MLAKRELLFVPLIGWTWYFLEIVFCKRKWEEDRDTVVGGLRRLADYPEYMWVSPCFAARARGGQAGSGAGPRAGSGSPASMAPVETQAETQAALRVPGGRRWGPSRSAEGLPKR